MIGKKAIGAPGRVWLAAQQDAARKLVGRAANRGPTRDFAITLMLTAVVGVGCQLLELVVDVGRSAGWWQ